MPPPDVSLFRRFRCHLDRPPALHGLLRLPLLPGVSRFRRIGSHLRRVTQASRPGTMAAGAREQTASCDAFVMSRRLPAPEAPPSRTSTACLIAKTLRRSPEKPSARPSPPSRRRPPPTTEENPRCHSEKNPPQLLTIPPHPETLRNSKKPSSPTEKTSVTPKKSQKTMKIWLKEQKMFFWPYHRGGGIFIFL